MPFSPPGYSKVTAKGNIGTIQVILDMYHYLLRNILAEYLVKITNLSLKGFAVMSLQGVLEHLELYQMPSAVNVAVGAEQTGP